MYTSKITGLGYYVPENVVTNDDLSKLMDTNDAWIQERTGIKERRHIKKGDGNSTSVMAVKASTIAIKRAGLKPKDIDMIVFATLKSRYVFSGWRGGSSGITWECGRFLPWMSAISAVVLSMPFRWPINL